MSTIYNWAEIPEEVKWVATDVIGVAFGYAEKPTLDSDEEDWGGDPIKCIHGFWDNPFIGDWRESLEARPTHPCSGKCTEYRNEQCKNCLVGGSDE